MKSLSFIFVLLLLFVACQQQNSTFKHDNKAVDSLFINSDFLTNFDTIKTHSIPSGWFTAVTGNNEAGKWAIIDEQNGKSIGQISDKSSGYLFNLLILKQLDLKNLAISLKIKAIAGKEDQGGGIVWRYQNADNYYIARANPLESNFRLYKVINGNRMQLKSYNLPVTAQIWHNISIVHNESLIRCYFDGQLFIETKDSSINKAGKIGFWTKADAQTNFDDLKIKNLK